MVTSLLAKRPYHDDFDKPAIRPSTLPSRAGIDLKPTHFEQFLETLPNVGFFEIHAETYMVEDSYLHYHLNRIREDYPLSVHGLALSIGSSHGLDMKHLSALRYLLDRYQPAVFSDHLSWLSHASSLPNDLFPLPYNRETLGLVCCHIDQIQTYLGRQLLVENPATSLAFSSSTMSEADFMCEMVQRTGCGLLLNVNNLYIASVNHGRDPVKTLNALPLSEVGEIHLAGFAQHTNENGSASLLKNYSSEVANIVWDLYVETLKMTDPVGTLIEREANALDFPAIMAEANRADMYLHHLTRSSMQPYVTL